MKIYKFGNTQIFEANSSFFNDKLLYNTKQDNKAIDKGFKIYNERIDKKFNSEIKNNDIIKLNKRYEFEQLGEKEILFIFKGYY